MFAVPELTVPSPAAHRRLPPAALIRTVAADPTSWRHLLRYQPEAPSRVPLPLEHPEVKLWLTGWLPGQAMAAAGGTHGAFTVVSGVIIVHGEHGSHVVRAGQTRVLGPGQVHRLVNLGGQPAITLHAEAPAA